ncbi:uncharacterized protein LOC126119342 [Schistocerca cancellata]|uniref:uncharacterized protein LOC126119342 n=1 Tax=Schistocerca cancellata TaxID=274614 RepID=UPI002117ABBF|nr:uncharacterized protein LOC126119342 [Schistocerca cancellata]
MHKSKSGASAQAAYTPQVYWFQMLKFLDQSTEADESVCNMESTESETGSKRATPTFEEMFAHEMQEPVACSEAQPQPLRQERPPTKRRRVTPDVVTNVMVEASRTLQAMADAARSMPVHEDLYTRITGGSVCPGVGVTPEDAVPQQLIMEYLAPITTSPPEILPPLRNHLYSQGFLDCARSFPPV